MVKTLVKSLVPLATALVSAGLAWLMLKQSGVAIATIVLGLLVIVGTASAYEFGESSLPEHPVQALNLMETQRVSYWIISAVGAALVIRVGLLFSDEGLKGADKELIGVVGAGATAFVTAMFAAWSDDKADASLAEKIRSSFQSRYVRPDTEVPEGLSVHRFPPGSPGERFVHSSRYQGISGWKRADRRARAKGIKDELER
jgi:hypothetical protein